MDKRDISEFKGTIRKDLSNLVFGSLIVLRVAGCNKSNKVVYECKCICGNLCYIVGSYLNNGDTKSCGCLYKKSNKIKNIKHGMTDTPEYRALALMKNRCYNKKDKRYPQYGGRGIEVCSRWLEKECGFTNFYEDMGKKPHGRYSIDRINNDGNYSPENCRWATNDEQSRNTSRNCNITYNDKTMCLTDWARELGISQPYLSTLISKGLNIDEYFKKNLK